MSTLLSLDEVEGFGAENGPTIDFQLVTTQLSDGGYVVTWSRFIPLVDVDIRGQRFDASGRPVGAEFAINVTVADEQLESQVTALTDGRFVVTWVDRSTFSADTFGAAVRAQVFSSNGARLGPELLVNTTTGGNEDKPSITALANGGFIVAWQDDSRTLDSDPATGSVDVAYQVFSDTGVPLGIERVVFTNVVDGYEGTPIVAALADGRAVLVFGTGANIDTRFKFLLPSGNQGSSITTFVNVEGQAGNQAPLAAVGLAGGEFVIVYADRSAGDGDTNLYYRVFNAAGTALGAATLVHDASTMDETNAKVKALPDGGFLITWTSLSQIAGVTDANVLARAFNAAGQPTTAQTVIATSTDVDALSDVAVLDDGAFAFVWNRITAIGTPSQDFRLSEQRWASFEENDGTPGADTVIGTAIRDRVLALGGADSVFGAGAGDFIDGGAGDDYLSGDGGDDQLFGERGGDVLLGGDGDDVLDASGNDGAVIADAPDELVGGDGEDTASYARAIANVIVDLAGAFAATNEATGDSFLSVENLRGSVFADLLGGDEAANLLSGGAGADVLLGRGGADRLRGGEGSDVASYGDAPMGVTADMEAPGAGTGQAAGDVFESIETLEGSGFADILRGTVGSQSLLGGNGSGDDVLEGRAGGDILNGGGGNDAASYSQSRTGVTADLGAAGNNTGDAAGDTFENMEGVSGSRFADTLRGDVNANTLGGRDGDDVLQGRGGGDRLFGEGGADLLFGEDGDDVLDGGVGGDTLMGGLGGDVLSGREGADVLDGGGGADVADYRDKTVAVTLTLNGASNATVLVGGVAEDTLRNVERAYGGSGSDQFTGDAGVNLFNGYDGNDILRGAEGADTLNGGNGLDAFIYATLSDSTVGAAGRDTISAFDSGTDDINVSLIDANTTLAGNQTFTLGVLAAGQAGRLQVTANGAGSWLVQGDVTGDGAADFAIVVNGEQPVAGDFIL